MKMNWNSKGFEAKVFNYMSDRLEDSAKIIEQNCKIEADVVTGKLRDDIYSSTDKILQEATIGNTDAVPYALFVELGTKNQAADPYLLRGLENSKPAINNIFTQKI
jgi:HK97 gp10 family phage protein